MKIIEIPFYENYSFDKNGFVYYKNKMVEIDENNMIKIYNIPIKRDEFLMRFMIGNIKLNIIHKDFNEFNCNSKNMCYDIGEVIKIDETTIQISNKIFKSNKYLPGIFISRDGIVYNIHTNSFRMHTFNINGYICIKFSKNDPNNTRKQNSYMLHRLVYEAWVGDITDCMEINHIDRNKWNNDVDNLECISHLENMRHMFNDDRSDSMFSLDIIEYFCKSIQENKRAKQVAFENNINDNETIRRMERVFSGLRQGLIYKDIASKYDFSNYDYNTQIKSKPKKYKRLSKKDIKNIKFLLNYYSPMKVSKLMNKSYKSVLRIKNMVV